MTIQANYQQQLAESLIKSIGLKEALQFARTNRWEGVLRHILQFGRKSPERQDHFEQWKEQKPDQSGW